MLEILGKLKSGDQSFPQKYKESVNSWSDILDYTPNISEEDLAEKLGPHQMLIERICGERYLGKTVTAVSGFHYLYDDAAGFEDNRNTAIKLLKAFELSMVSVEVKSLAKQAAKVFHLEYT